MIGRLNHVAIAVPNLAAATQVYRDTLGARVSDAVDQPEHGVTTVFIELPNTKVELLSVFGENSPIAAFLERNPNGGIHHLCYEVPDIRAARDAMRRKLGDASWEKPKDYTWHHTEDVGRMILMPMSLNDAVGHTGGIPAYRMLTGDYDA